MRFSRSRTDDNPLLIDEHKTATTSLRSSSYRDPHSSIQCHNTSRQDSMPSPSSEYIYTEFVKAIKNNEFIEEKRLLKRASWTAAGLQEHGLPPTGKRTDNEQITVHRNPNRVRMRPKVSRYFQSQQPGEYPIHFGRPVSYNETYDRHSMDHQQPKLSQSPLNRTGSFSHRCRESSRTPSSSSIDTVVQITTRASPSLDSSDFISDTSAASSITTTNTATSLSSTIPSQISRRASPSFERICSSNRRPLLSEYHQQNSKQIDYKFVSPVSLTNTIPLSSPISSSPTSFTCPKGHEQSFSSPMNSSLNQYREFTLQTFNADVSRDDMAPSPTTITTTTTRSIMTMSMSPNRHHNQTRSAKAIIISAQISPTSNVTITTNNTDGLKQQQQRDQTESTIASATHGCLKSPTNTNSNNRRKKSVHFDWHSPERIRSTSSSPVKINLSTSNQQPSVTIASLSSALSTGNDEQTKLDDDDDDDDDVETLREKERIETTRRTNSPRPLTTTPNTIHRSFSLSPSPLAKEEKNDSRRHREKEEEEEEEEKKENVDEANCTTSRRVTTAAAHLHCTTTTATVTFNDGSNNVSQKKESNNTNNSNTDLLKRPSSSSSSIVDQPMPSNSLLVKTTSLNTIVNPQVPQQQQSSSTTTTAKKLLSNGFLSLIGRSNSNHNKSSTSTEENKQLRRTSSTQLRAQRKAKQQTILTAGTNGNKRLSADVESLFPVSSINNNQCKLSKDDIRICDKVTTNHNIERQSSISLVSTTSTDKNINATTSSNNDSSISPCTNSNINNNNNNTLSMPTNSTTTTTTIIQTDEGDSLNNGLLFQPVNDRKCDYVLHNHQTTIKEPFFLSPPKSLSNRDESTMMQTSTLIISAPPQYHYYLYPPINNNNNNTNTLSSSSSSSSSTSSSLIKNPKIISTTNRTISNVSINSVSTNSSSSYPSYESQTHDNDYQQSSQTPLNAEDETLSSSTYSMTNKTRQKKVVQSALIDWKMKSSSDTSNDSKTKPVILSDSVQAFWPPPPSPSTLDKDSGLTTMTLTTEQTKQSDPILISNNMMSSNANQLDIVTTKEESGSYSEQHVFSNGCLRNASDTSLEDTQASYTERLREKSRSIPMNGSNETMHSYLKRSVSRETLIRTEVHDRPKSAGQQTRTIPIMSKTQENDFQSKRNFFENQTYPDTTSSSSLHANILPTKPKLYTLSPSNNQANHAQRNVTRRSWNDLSSRQPTVLFTPPSPDSSFEQIQSPQPPAIRKPVRIVKAVQRSPPLINESTSPNRPLPTSKTYLLAKPGLFSASPITSSQKLPIKSSHSTRSLPSRDEYDLQLCLKEFAQRYPQTRLLNELLHLIISNGHHLSTDYIRALFPKSDRLRRIRSRESSAGDTHSSNSSSDYTHRTVSNDSCIFDDDALRQAEDLLINLKRRLGNLKENQRTINEESEDNRILGVKLLNIIESNAEANEIEKFKLHINEIDTITSILLKLSSRLAKVENDLLTLSDSDEHTKASLLDRREKAQQKHDEAKSLKDGIDRRSRVVTNILRKYFSSEQYDDYEHFIRMKSTLLMDEKDLEENILILERQIQIFNQLLRNHGENSSKILSSTA